MTTQHSAANDELRDRQHWMSVLARASEADLEAELKHLGAPEYRHLRAPEIGLTMVRGRTGGTGAPFNLGETTMSRCVVELNNGHRGFGYVRGRSRRHAELAAVFDGLLQGDPGLQESVIQPLHERWLEKRNADARKAAATRVNFMTLVRGE